MKNVKYSKGQMSPKNFIKLKVWELKKLGMTDSEILETAKILKDTAKLPKKVETPKIKKSVKVEKKEDE